MYLGEGLRRSFAMANPFVLSNKICLKQMYHYVKSSILVLYIEPFSSNQVRGTRNVFPFSSTCTEPFVIEI